MAILVVAAPPCSSPPEMSNLMMASIHFYVSIIDQRQHLLLPMEKLVDTKGLVEWSSQTCRCNLRWLMYFLERNGRLEVTCYQTTTLPKPHQHINEQCMRLCVAKTMGGFSNDDVFLTKNKDDVSWLVSRPSTSRCRAYLLMRVAY